MLRSRLPHKNALIGAYDVPTRQYSEILQKIYDDPKYYEQILEDNKGNLKTEAAYKKVERQLTNCLIANCAKQPKSIWQ